MNTPYFILSRSETQENAVKKPLKLPAYFKSVDSEFTVIAYRALDASYFRHSFQWCELTLSEYQALAGMDVQS